MLFHILFPCLKCCWIQLAELPELSSKANICLFLVVFASNVKVDCYSIN